MKPRDLLPALALVVVLAAIAVAQPGQPAELSVGVHGPLERFNLTACFYRGMNISLTMSMEDLLSPAPPPRCPSLEPVDGGLTCSCRLEPAAWWPNATWGMLLGPAEKWSSTVITTVPGEAGLGAHSVGYGCGCWWREWCRYTTTTTAVYCSWCCCRWENNTCAAWGSCCCSTETYTVTVTSTTVERAELCSSKSITVLPRRPGDEWLGFDLSCNFTEPGMPAPCNLSIYNLAPGLVDNETVLPPNNGSIYLYWPGVELYVPEAGVMQPVGGWVEPGYAWPPSYRPPRPPQEPAAMIPFLLPVPQPPSTTVPVVAVVSAVADNSTNGRVYTTTIRHTFTVRLGYGWNITVDDDCRTLNWVAVNETGVHTVILDTRPPVWRRRGDMILIEDPGMCGRLSRILVERGGGVYLEDRPRGRVYALDAAALPPGNYTVIAVDQAGHTLTLRLRVEPARQGQWLVPALVLLIVLAAIGTMTGRKWVRV